MKKLIITLVAAVLGCAIANAQDLNAAAEAFNNGVNANEAGNRELALQSFKEALAIAETLSDEGAAQIVANCKTSIPALQLALAKDAYKESDFDAAIAGLRETIEVAAKYENEDILADAKALIPQILMNKANGFYNAKDYAAGVEGYKAVLAEDATNGTASLRLGLCYKGLGDKAAAIEAFKAAAENGQAAAANKQASTLYLQDANANLSAKKYESAITSALEANKYLENAKSYQIAGTAASALKKHKDAIEYFEKYLEIEPKAANATQICYNIAVSYHQLGNKAKAKEYYQKAVSDPRVGASAKKMLEAL